MQGDILLTCPVLEIEEIPLPDDVPSKSVPQPEGNVLVFNMIVLSQSCDIQSEPKVAHVLLCPLRTQSEILADETHVLKKKSMLEKATKDQLPPFFVLAPFEGDGRDGSPANME